MRRLVVTNRAEADLRGIWRWSFERFGEARADRYLDELDEGMRTCGSEPEKGTRRDALRPGYWSRLVRKHVAFYTFTDDEVVIGRVLHGGMDADLHLPSKED